MHELHQAVWKSGKLPRAQIIGAVNTLIPLRTLDSSSLLERNRAGPTLSVYGDNTDWVGICECVRKNLSPINTIRPRTTALIIGAGVGVTPFSAIISDLEQSIFEEDGWERQSRRRSSRRASRAPSSRSISSSRPTSRAQSQKRTPSTEHSVEDIL